MRYRTFAADGLSCSAVTVAMPAGRTMEDIFALICGSLEEGVNTFSVAADDVASLQAVRQASASVGRHLLILILRVNLDGPDAVSDVRSALHASGLTRFDAIMPERPITGVLPPEQFALLQAMKRERLTLRIGLAAEAQAAAAVLNGFDFDILALRYTMTSGWAERNVLKAAAARGVTVFGYNHYVGSASPAVQAVKGLARLFRRAAPAAAATPYAFLDETPNWTARQISLVYVLAEPAVASVIVEASDSAVVSELAGTVERELPAGVAAQIEMARFAHHRESAA